MANLPYNITKDFIRAVLPLGAHLAELHVMLQEEVARRLVNSTPGGPDYRAANIFVHFFSRPRYRFLIPKEKYFPVPGVDGALVSFQLRPPGSRPDVPSERAFVMLFNKAFSERRKMVRNSVQPLYPGPQVEAALVAAGLRPDARAQDLSVDDFVRFHWRLHELLLEEALGPGAVAGDGAGMPEVEI